MLIVPLSYSVVLSPTPSFTSFIHSLTLSLIIPIAHYSPLPWTGVFSHKLQPRHVLFLVFFPPSGRRNVAFSFSFLLIPFDASVPFQPAHLSCVGSIPGPGRCLLRHRPRQDWASLSLCTKGNNLPVFKFGQENAILGPICLTCIVSSSSVVHLHGEPLLFHALSDLYKDRVCPQLGTVLVLLAHPCLLYLVLCHLLDRLRTRSQDPWIQQRRHTFCDSHNLVLQQSIPSIGIGPILGLECGRIEIVAR